MLMLFEKGEDGVLLKRVTQKLSFQNAVILDSLVKVPIEQFCEYHNMMKS